MCSRVGYCSEAASTSSKLGVVVRYRSNGASTLHLLYRAGVCVEELFTYFVGFNGPSARQLAVLMAVARGNGRSQAAIVRATGIDRSTTSEILRRLQKKGWVKRRRAKRDGRTYAVQLTTAGYRIVLSGAGAVRETDETVLSVLSKRRRAVLVRGLGKIVERHSVA